MELDSQPLLRGPPQARLEADLPDMCITSHGTPTSTYFPYSHLSAIVPEEWEVSKPAHIHILAIDSPLQNEQYSG